ncbi:MAG: hypothetical protein KHY74_00705, partial [Veillonella sp.]|nr:hypothetical protein [Veillonella sp.]
MNTDTSANTKNQINIWANTTNKENPATPGASTASGSGTANANDIDPSTYGTEIGIAIGAQNKIKPGITTNAGGGSSIAMGIQNEVRGNRNVAIGTNSKTYGENSIALGTKVEAGTGHGIAIGSDDNGKATVAYGGTTPNATGSNVTNAFALAIGSGAQADGRANGTSGGIAIGQLVKATHNNTIAIGVNTTASDSNSVAIGSSAQATQKLSTAYGPNTNANSKGGVAIGTNAAVGTDTGLTTAITGATAVGAYAEAQSENGSAFGRNAKADKNAEKATALGAYATANIAGGVALGSESKTTKGAGEASYNPATGRTNDYKPLTNNAKAALTSTRGAVSIGDDSAGITRQLTGLAAGNQDTDAVNVAQLKAVNLKYAGDSTQVTGSTDVRLNDGTFNVNGDGTLISTEATTTGIKVTAKVGGNITNTDGKAVAPTTNGIATTDNVTQAINNSGWNANASANGGTLTGSATATKVKPGDNVTFSAGKNLTVAQTLGTNTQQYTYALSSTLKDIESIQNGTSKITLNNGGGTTISGGNLSVDGNKITNVAKGTNDTDAVNYSQIKDLRTEVKAGNGITVTPSKGTDGHDIYTVSANATGGAASTESVVKKAAATGDTNIADVSVADGKNVKDPGAQYEVSVSKNAVKDAAREAVTVNNGGNTDNPITVTPTDDAANHTTTYAVTFDGNKAAKQIPLTYKANGSGDKTVKLDKGLDFTNGTNTTAEIGNDGVVKFNLKDTVALTNAGSLTVGDTKVNNDGLTISGGPSVTTGGIDAGSQKITNVAPGTISSTSTDAVNGSQLYDVDQKFNNTVKLTGNAGATDGQALNKANGLSFGVIGANNGKYISTSANGSDVTVDLSTDAKKLLNNTVEVKGKNAATVTTSTETTADGGTKTIYTVDVANTGTVAKSSWNIASDKVSATEGTVAAGSGAAQNIADTKTVTMQAGKNLTVNQTNDNGNASVAFALDKDLKDLTSVTTDKVTTKEIGLQDPTGKVTTIKNDGDRITYTKDGDTKVHKVATLDDEKHIKPGSYAVQNDGSVTMTYVDGNGDPVANTEAKITGIAKQDLSNIDNAGKNVITGLGTIVKAGDNVTVSEASNATTGQKTYTVNAVTPAVYTTPDGEKLTKDKDGKFHKVGETAEYTGDIITSFENPKAAAGQTTKDGGMIVNNIGSAIKNQTPTVPAGQTATYLDKLKAAADAGSNVKNAAVNVSDLHNTAEALKANELHIRPTASNTATPATATAVENGGTINYAAGKNLTVKQEIDATNKTHTYTYSLDKDLTNLDKVVVNGKDGIAGKDGVTIVGPQGATGATGIPGTNGIDGKVGITGKDGKDAVSIAGKDGVGTIGLTGPQGPAGTNGKSVDISTENGTKTLVKPEANNND